MLTHPAAVFSPRARNVYIIYVSIYNMCIYLFIRSILYIIYTYMDISIYFPISRIYNIYIDIVMVIYIIYTICTYLLIRIDK